MEKKGGDDQFAVANLVGDDAANNDAKAETRKTGAVDVTQLLTGKTELSPPVGKDAAANRGAHPRRKDRRKAAVQKPLGIRCNSVSSSVAHRFFVRLLWVNFWRRREQWFPLCNRRGTCRKAKWRQTRPAGLPAGWPPTERKSAPQCPALHSACHPSTL